MTYRADPVSQRDGSRLASSNCRMAAGAAGLDFETRGAVQETAAELRERQLDQVGGTDSSDLALAWHSYGRILRIRDGLTFDDALVDLTAGRLVMLDVWHAAAGGPCLSGSGAYGHTLAVAPEWSSDRTRVLVSDPWCLPAAWRWWPLAKLRDGAEEWGARVSVRGLDSGGDAARDLMREHTPDHPSLDTDTGGAADGGPILYTTTNGGADMAIQAAGGLTTGWRIDLPPDTMVYADANLTDPMRRIGAIVEWVVYVGLSIGESVAGGSRAVLIRTREPYPDGAIRWTIGYVPTSVGKPYGVAAPVPPNIAEVLRQRDEMWREWLIAGAPGEP